MSVILGFGAFFLYLGAFLCFGALFPEKWHKNSLLNIILLGFPAYFALFQVVALPLKLMDVPLKTVSVAWLAVLAAVLGCVLLFRRKMLFACLAKSVTGFRADLFGVLWIVLAAGLLLALVANDTHLSGYDYSFYVGTPVSSVYGNTIENIDVYTGEWGNDSQRNYYLLNTNTVHSAVMYQLLDLHPVIEAEITLSALMPLLFLLYLYKAGLLLFREDAVLAKMFSSLAVLALLFSFGIAGSSMYFAYRPYEGKAVCSYLIPAAIFCFFMMIQKEKEAEEGWAGAFLVAIGGIAFTNSALFIVPGLIGLLGLPYLIVRRDRGTAVRALLVIAPCLVWLAAHALL